MKVGSLFAEIGFKVDQAGLENFSNAIKSFQKTIKSGLKDLKEYAKVAREISQAMRDAYVPSQQEASSRYRAQTAHMRSQSRVNNAWAKRERSARVSEMADAYLKSQRAKFFEQDSNTRASNALSRKRMLDMKESGLIGTHTGKYSAGLKKLVAGIFGFSMGGILGGLGAMGNPIIGLVTIAISKLISVIWRATKWLGNTFMQGIKIGLAYRDYRTFTGKSVKGLSDLMYASFGTSNLTPADILKDAAGFEKSFWDVYFGEGSVRPWQALGITPTGNGDYDMRTVLGAISNVPQKGLQRKLLSDFGLSEDYLNLIDVLQQENPTKTFEEVLDELQDTIDSVSNANFEIKRFGWEIDQIKVKIVDAIVKSGLLDTLKKMEPVIKEIVSGLSSSLVKVLQLLPPLLEKLNKWLAEKLMTPEEKEEYERLKYATEKQGEEQFYRHLGLLSKNYSAEKEWEKGNYFTAVLKGLSGGSSASFAEKVAYIQDRYHITIENPEQLGTVFNKIEERQKEMINGAMKVNDASASVPATP